MSSFEAHYWDGLAASYGSFCLTQLIFHVLNILSNFLNCIEYLFHSTYPLHCYHYSSPFHRLKMAVNSFPILRYAKHSLNHGNHRKHRNNLRSRSTQSPIHYHCNLYHHRHCGQSIITTSNITSIQHGQVIILIIVVTISTINIIIIIWSPWRHLSLQSHY